MRLLATLLICLLGLGLIPSPKPEASINTAILEWKQEYGAGWWLWGVQAIDYDNDGDDDIIVTQHNDGSRILEYDNGAWHWADITNNLGKNFRPWVWDFNGDGLLDIAFRDTNPNTFYLNVGGDFVNLGFGYGTGNDPIRYIGGNWFGHDWGKWNWIGGTFKYQQYTNPLFGKLPQNLKNKINQDWNKQFYTSWFNELNSMVAVTGSFSYEPKWQSYCHFLIPRRGQLIDMSAKLGLPNQGSVVYMDDDVIMITGQGLYIKGQPWQKVPGSLTNFLAVIPEWPHQVFRSGDMVVVNSPRGSTTKIYRYGTWELLNEISSWDGEPVAIGDFNGDGREDIAVGTGNDIFIKWG